MGISIALIEPEIPQNTGNIARTCAATGASLHLVKPLGFSLEDKYLKRAGLDYWGMLDIFFYENLQEFISSHDEDRLVFITTKSPSVYTGYNYHSDSILVFGKESRGLPEELLSVNRRRCVRIPMVEDARSLNLSNAAAVVLYEALRQNGFKGLQTEGHLHRLDWSEPEYGDLKT